MKKDYNANVLSQHIYNFLYKNLPIKERFIDMLGEYFIIHGLRVNKRANPDEKDKFHAKDIYDVFFYNEKGGYETLENLWILHLVLKSFQEEQKSQSLGKTNIFHLINSTQGRIGLEERK